VEGNSLAESGGFEKMIRKKALCLAYFFFSSNR